MTKVWADMGHKITVICGMVHYATGKKHEKYKGKYIFKEEYYKNINLIRCHVSEAYNKNFMEGYGHIFHLSSQAYMGFYSR